MDPQRRILTDGAVVVAGDRIVAVGDSASMLAGYDAAEMLDCRGNVVLPGLVDAHGHGGHALLKTIGADSLSWWMRIATRAYFEHTSEEYWRADAALAALERVRFGVTTGVSVLGSQPRSDVPAFGSAHAAAYAESGMRHILGVGPAGQPWPRDVGWWENDTHRTSTVGLDEMLSGAEETISAWHGGAGGRVRVYVTPYTMIPSLNPSGPLPPDQTLELTNEDRDHSERIRDLARRAGTRIHTDAFGGMIRLAHARDPHALLGPDVHFQHGFGLSPDEVAIIAETGTSVTHGPGVVVGALRGRCPVTELIDAGVTTAITTDGCAPMSSFDLFTAMRQAQTLTQLQLRDVYNLPPGTLLEMVTIEAAKAVGWDDEIGSIETGKAADLIVVDTRQAHLQPLHMPVQTLVYKASGQDVITTIVAGRVLMRDRRMTAVDADAVIEEANAQARLIVERGRLDRFITEPNWRVSRQTFNAPVPFEDYPPGV
jgi:cytosine/adenosine deaminase-related metal-dependent hydrolase